MRDPDDDHISDFDWGESLDDLDPEYWEHYFGGPEDDEFEPGH